MAASFQGPEPQLKIPPSYSCENSWRSSFSTTQSPPLQFFPQFSSDSEIEVWLSVFIGDLDPVSPRLDHARFSAKVNEEVFEIKDIRTSTDSSTRSIDSNSSREIPQRRLSEDLVAFDSIQQLANNFTGEVLACVKGGCSVCRKENPQFVVYRPLSATKSGYFELPDFAQVGRLISVIASHTSHITDKAEIDWSIGNIPNEHPYVCTLGVPVCDAEAECSRVAAVKAQAYIDAILEGRMKPKSVSSKLSLLDLASPRDESFSSNPDDERASSDYFGDVSLIDSSFSTSDSGDGRLYTVGMIAFVGRPSLQIDGPPKPGQLGCLIYSSTWPKSLLPGPSKNEADDAIDYCRIAGSHEQPILESAQYRCAVCCDLVPAKTLVHCPIGFTRTSANTTLEDSIQQPIMKLFQYVNGRWNFREVDSALGSKNDAQVFDFVVPICEADSVCEEVARTAAREFIKQLLPSESRLIFPGLEPDTDLKVLEYAFEDDVGWHRETPRLIVSKPVVDGLMTESPDRGEDPNDSTMSITKLRHLYEQRFGEEISKRDSLTSTRPRQSAEYNSPESEDPESDESAVWIYVRNDIEEASSEQGSETARQSRAEGDLAKRAERELLYQPMLCLDLWLIREAIYRDRSRVRSNAPSPATVLTSPETVALYQGSEGSQYDGDEGSFSGHSEDTEIWLADSEE
ncbi:hypothetical protein PHISCL_06307 [Aspergillus sclerotialis]|uniref:Uncharacterized protein n=1 Tax=Aspergillus sclerotialis TaxID=2070753 RepID=A0A3A2ZFH9_9EURO|nr:hypothetical protein PHISCL_06307 [Aspergillus sclerotialis]